jgi:hypothetical protein
MAKDIMVNIRFSATLLDKLHGLAASTGRRRGEIVRALLAAATLDDLPRAWTDPAEAAVLAEAETRSGGPRKPQVFDFSIDFAGLQAADGRE